MILNKIIDLSSYNNKYIFFFFDVGVIKGHWCIYLNNLSNSKNINSKIYAFEPSPYNFKYLKSKILKYKNIKLKKIAFSNKITKQKFYFDDFLNGTNSFSKNKSFKNISIKTNTIDNFIKKNKLRKIHFIKCDAEGFDFDIIKGAENSFNKGIIDFFQFEYNHRWIENRTFIKDVFQLIENKNYKIGKLCSNKILIFDKWHNELERFFECNYIIINQFLCKEFCYNVHFNNHNVLEYE